MPLHLQENQLKLIQIGHGLDNHGRTHDKFGIKNNWWTKEAEAKFMKNVNCIVRMYDHVKLPGTEFHINGNLTKV